MDRKYGLIFVPMNPDGTVIYRGGNYTTSATKRNVDVDGKKYYVKRITDHSTMVDALERNLEEFLENSFPEIIRKVKPSVPLRVEFILEDDEEND